jgi:O-antigen/teichoic acid export membrane protein
MSDTGSAALAEAPRSIRFQAASYTLWVFVASAVSRLVSFVLLGYVARQFAAGGLGEFNLVLAYMTVFGLLADLGLSQFLTREISASPGRGRELMRKGAVAALALGATALVLCNLIALAVGYEPRVRLWILIASFSALVTPAIIGLALLNATLQGRRVAAVTIANHAIGAAFVVGAVVTGQGIGVVIALMTLQTMIFGGLVMTAAGAWRLYRGGWRAVDLRDGLQIIGRAAPLGALVVMTLLIARLDTFLLSVISSAASVGYYSAAYRITEALSLIPAAFAATMLPVASRRVDRAEVAAVVEVAFRYLSLAGLPLAVGGIVLAVPILATIYGSGLEPATPAFRILIAGQVTYFLGSVAAATLVGMRRTRWVAITLAIIGPFNAVLCLIFLPRYDFEGAAWITLATELLATSFMLWALRRELGGRLPLPLGSLARAGAASLAMGALVWTLEHELGAPLGVSLAAGALIYPAALWAVGGLDRSDLALAIGLWKRR